MMKESEQEGAGESHERGRVEVREVEESSGLGGEGADVGERGRWRREKEEDWTTGGIL